MNAVRTPVCELLGIDQPIVLAPMVSVPELAAAVSNAGALGMLTLTWSEDVGAVVRETAALTTRPFGGNLVLTEDRDRAHLPPVTPKRRCRHAEPGHAGRDRRPLGPA